MLLGIVGSLPFFGKLPNIFKRVDALLPVDELKHLNAFVFLVPTNFFFVGVLSNRGNRASIPSITLLEGDGQISIMFPRSAPSVGYVWISFFSLNPAGLFVVKASDSTGGEFVVCNVCILEFLGPTSSLVRTKLPLEVFPP